MKFLALLAIILFMGCVYQYGTTTTTTTTIPTTTTTTSTTTTTITLPIQLFRELNQTECWNVSRIVIEKYNLTNQHTCSAEEMIVDDKNIITVTLISGGCPATADTRVRAGICSPVISFDAVVYNNSAYKMQHSLFLTEKEKIDLHISGKTYKLYVKDIIDANHAVLDIDGRMMNATRGEFFNISEAQIYTREIFFYGSTRTDNQMILKIIITPEMLETLDNA